MKTAARLMVVDDEPQVSAIVERFARPLGFEVQSRGGGAEALAAMPAFRPDVVVVDLQMPEVGGLDVLRTIREEDPECKVILMTGNPTVDTAIQAVSMGAMDYLGKPLDFDRLRRLLTQILDEIDRRRHVLETEAELAGGTGFEGMVGRSVVMQQLFDLIRRLAPHVRTVLVTGETGTGKELVARALHRLGPRSDRPFITLNCSAVVEGLFESELFGHVRGAFTGATDTKTGLFERADQGTLFLDEVGELPLALQPKLLRALEYGEVQKVGSLHPRKVDVHVIAATNRDLRADSAAGTFRSDLLYRLGVMDIHLLPLRERRDDIPYLTARFLTEFSSRLKKPIVGVSAGAERLLHEAHWPGNLRELRHVLERACILSDSGMLTERELAPALGIRGRKTGSPAEPAAEPALDESDGSLSSAQKAQIERVLRETGGNKAAAAKRLGVSRRALYRWIDRLGVTT